MNRPDGYPVVTICGSMRYYVKMLETAAILTEQGWIVLMPFTVVEEKTGTKEMLDDMHRVKIDMSRGIVVIGTPDDSTKSEIEYALSQKKTIRYVSV